MWTIMSCLGNRAKVTARNSPVAESCPRWRANSFLRPVSVMIFSGLKCRVAAVSWLPISVWHDRRVHVSRKPVKCLTFPLERHPAFYGISKALLWVSLKTGSTVVGNKVYLRVRARVCGLCMCFRVCVCVCVCACYEKSPNISFKLLSVSKFHILPTSCSVYLKTCKSKITMNIFLMFSTQKQ